MNTREETMTPEEEKKNNRFSFIVGIFIAMAIIILLTVISLLAH
jgi:heme/copper-type cytochrome/quinol oxidase subunit 2